MHYLDYRSKSRTNATALLRTVLLFGATIITSVETASPASAGSTSGYVAPRISASLDALNRFNQTHSLNDLESAIDSLYAGGGQLMAHTSPQEYISQRQTIVAKWVQILQTIQRFWDPTYDPSDPKQEPVTCVMPPGNGTLPCGVDPSAIRDSKARAQYKAAIASNKEKEQRSSFQSRLRYLQGGALTDLGMTLDMFRRANTPADASHLHNIVQKSGLDETTQKQIETML